MSDTDFLVNVETNNVSWRKRKREEETLQLELKKPRSYYYRLASESSKGSEEDTESVYSLQGRETDLAKDTTDTDEKSDSDDEYEVIEYEVASLSESDHGILGTTETDSDISDSEVYIAAIDAVFDSSVETWITDCEESDNSSLDDSVETRLGFSTCVQCKFQNDNPLYRYCEKCFQVYISPSVPLGSHDIRLAGFLFLLATPTTIFLVTRFLIAIFVLDCFDTYSLKNMLFHNLIRARVMTFSSTHMGYLPLTRINTSSNKFFNYSLFVIR